MQAAWPTEAQVGDLMVSAGLASAAPSGLQIYIDAAVAEWERRTGWRPFLEEASADWRFDPPPYGGLLDLRTGFTAITAVRTGLTATDSTGTLLTVEEDYILLPLDARANERPFTEIQFLLSPGSGPKSIKVTGTKGFHDEIADDVWLAVARHAAAMAIDDLTTGGGEVEKVKQGAVEITYRADSSVLSKWNLDSRAGLISGYRRMVI